MKMFIAKKEHDNGYRTEYRIKAETKEEALEKIRKISGEYSISVKEA